MKDKCLKVFVLWVLKKYYIPLRVTSYFLLPSSLPNHVHIHMHTRGAGFSFYSLPLTGKNMNEMRTCPSLSHCWCYLWFMNKILWWGDCGGGGGGGLGQGAVQRGSAATWYDRRHFLFGPLPNPSSSGFPQAMKCDSKFLGFAVWGPWTKCFQFI